ncbi:MAG TPA: T9SS type A sorting domain-containing protein [bacterium]|jgi:hypothetical protein
MKCCIIVLACLICAGALFAQPWQWQRMDGDFRDPSGFETPFSADTSAMVAVGDFDGDGRDEVILLSPNGAQVAVRNADNIHWTLHTITQPLGYGRLWATNLDDDPAKELVVYDNPPRAWKLQNAVSWRWTRNDMLLFDFALPHTLEQAIFGDYNGDGELDGIIWQRVAGYDLLTLEHRSTAGDWSADTVVTTGEYPVTNLFDGDFDHDGDLDFAAAPGYVIATNLHPGIRFSTYAPWQTPYLSGPGGGDLNGDGEWEGLFRLPGYSGFAVVVTASATHASSTTHLGHVSGMALGTVHTAAGTTVAIAHNQPSLANGWTEFDLLLRNSAGWVDDRNTLVHAYSGKCLAASMADVNGDGRKDLLLTMGSGNPQSEGYRAWEFQLNTGAGTIDRFETDFNLTNSSFRHVYNPDTLLQFAQIGNITGSDRAELAALGTIGEESPRILFYEFTFAQDTALVLHPEWSAGLPEGLLNFRLVDLDGDGVCELLGKTFGDESSGHWDAYFYRNGEWDIHAGVLPVFSAPEISFADVNNDSHPDLLTPRETWLNLSPSPAENIPFILQPSSFTLSCAPNPFNPQTRLSFSLPEAERVNLGLFDILGQRLATLHDGLLSAGEHTISFDGSTLSAGIYFARLLSPHRQATLKLMLIK